LALLCALPIVVVAAEAGSAQVSFGELEARGARIGEIRIDVRNIFDVSQPDEDYAIFRLANRLHVGTRPEVIREALLFRTGERVSARLVDETERLLRARRNLYDVEIVPTSYRDGVVDIRVTTRDTWTIALDGKYERSGGEDKVKFGVKDSNFLGRGMTLGLLATSEPDRSGWEFEADYPRAFDGWTQLGYQRGQYDDGSRWTATVSRPFYALDTRWAYGATWEHYTRTDPIYSAGETVAGFRHESSGGEIYGGWSTGLVGGWTQRVSLGLAARDDAYGVDPDEEAPTPFPVDHKVRGPMLVYEAVQDRFVRRRNHDHIARTEFVQLGLRAKVQVSRALASWGSSRSAWLHKAELSQGFTLPMGHDVLAKLASERRIDSRGEALDYQGVALRYYAPQARRWAFFGALALDRIGTAAAPDLLELGGDNGLRGYPLRYQQGERRALLTLEQRYYTDWYPFRLARVGAAAFVDVGRAWKGVNPNLLNDGWLADVGIGLRLALDRTSFGNVLHLDVAHPLERGADPDIKSIQFLFKARITF
jgi:hypothetical protein